MSAPQEPEDFYLKKSEAQARMDELDEIWKESDRRQLKRKTDKAQQILSHVVAIWLIALIMFCISVYVLRIIL